MKLKTQKNVDYRKLKIRDGNNVDYDFSDYKTFKELFRDFYYKETTIDDAKRKQDEFSAVIAALKNYAPRANMLKQKNKLLNNVKDFYEGREKIIEGFKNEIFPIYYDQECEEQMRFEREEEEGKRKKKNKKKNQKKTNFQIY